MARLGQEQPGSPLARELGLPLLAKDEIKQALMDGLGQPATVEDSRRLGRAAVLAILRAALTCPGAVLDSTWFAYTEPLVRRLPGSLVEIRCVVPVDVARARYRARAAARHPGHLDGARPDEELWGDHHRPLGVGPVLTVDTGGPVDVADIVQRVHAAAYPGPADRG